MSKLIFISYSQRDSEWLEKLQEFLKPYIRGRKVTSWDDTQIDAGDLWQEQIKKALAEADIAILLVSQYFLASDFIHQNELPPILEAAKNRGLTIFWIPIKPSAYETSPIRAYQPLGNPRRPLSRLDESEQEAELVEMCEKIAGSLTPETEIPEESEIVSSSMSAQAGIQALPEIMKNPEIRDSVVEFKSVFGTSCRQIEALGYYKDLHDLLHTLQFSCYNYLMTVIRSAKARPDDPLVWDHVFDYAETLQDIVEGLDDAAHHIELNNAVSWVPNLTSNLRILFSAVSANNVEDIERAIRPIQRVLAIEPVRLNDRLSEAARALPLPDLIEALTRIRNKLVTQSNITRIFNEGVEALNRLDGNLQNLRAMHDKWQTLDIEIRRVDGTISQGLDELENSWADLKTLTEEICQNSDEDWAILIKESVTKLDGAMLNKNEVIIRQYFHNYRSRTSRRFFDVDVSLKRLCGELRDVGRPLAMVWEIIR